MPTIHQVIAQKGSHIHSIEPGVTVHVAIKRMADHDIGLLVVMDGRRLVGIFTERHYARNVFLKGRASPQTPVGDVMEKRVVCIHPDQQVEEGMAVMTFTDRSGRSQGRPKCAYCSSSMIHPTERSAPTMPCGWHRLSSSTLHRAK